MLDLMEYQSSEDKDSMPELHQTITDAEHRAMLEYERQLRKEAEYALEKKSRELSDLNKKLKTRIDLAFSATGDGIWERNLMTNDTWFSQRTTEMLGYDQREIPATWDAWQLLVHPDDLPDALNLVRRFIEGDERALPATIRFEHKDGSIRYILLRAVLQRDENGNVVTIVGSHTDVTELQEEKEKAEAANIAKGDFLATMSHELRTPMNGIIGLSEILLDMNLKGEELEVAETINNSAQNLLGLINDVLDFSKIEAGELSLEMHSFNLKDHIRDCIKFLRYLAEEKGLSLSADMDMDTPDQIYNDPLRIRQVLNNLVGNAVKFTEKGQVRVKIAPYPASGPVTHIRFEVEDTGIGIPKDKLGIIFNKFETVEGRNFGGTGLGLSISQRLTEIMGGKIEVDSDVGKGTVFSFMIDANLDKVEETNISDLVYDTHEIEIIDGAISRPHANANLLRGKRILSVDDHPVNLMMLTKLLTKLGAKEIVEATEGKQAVQCYRDQGPFDFVILDYHMPEMDGIEAALNIRAFEKQNDLSPVTILAVTADAMRETQEKCLKAGMDDYMTKPISKQLLTQKIGARLNFEQDGLLASWDHSDSKYQHNSGDAQTQHEHEHVEPCAGDPVNLAHLHQFTDGDPEEEQEFFTVFIQQAEESITALRQMIDTNDIEGWKKAAHKLKGSSANLGANTLSSLCKMAEERFEAQKEDKQQMLNAIENEYNRVQKFLKSVHT